jgi:hypothetical protein
LNVPDTVAAKSAVAFKIDINPEMDTIQLLETGVSRLTATDVRTLPIPVICELR